MANKRVSELGAVVTADDAYELLVDIGTRPAKKATIAKIRKIKSTGSSVERSLSARFAERANVVDFGADPDGIIDSTDAINRAAASLPYSAANIMSRRGGGLYFPPGKYRINGVILIIAGTKVYGESEESVVIESENTTTDIFYCVTADGSSSTRIQAWTFEHLTIGHKIGVTPSAGAGINIRPQTITSGSVASRMYLKNVFVYNCYNGVKAYGIQGGSVRDCNFFYNIADGFLMDGYATHVKIESSASSANGGHGWRINGAAYCKMDACSADSNAGYGYYWDVGTEQSAKSNNMTSCGAEGNNTGAAYLRKQKAFSLISPLGVMDPGVNAENGVIWDEPIACVVIAADIETQVNCTGIPMKVFNFTDDGSGSSVLLGMGGQIGPFAASTTFVNPETAPVSWFGWQSDSRNTINNAGQPSRQFEIGKPAHGVGAAGALLARMYQRSTDAGGSAKVQISSDADTTTNLAGASFLELEHNGQAGSFTEGIAGDARIATSGNLYLTAGKAAVLPRLTKVQRDALTGVNGMAIYQTDNTPGLRVYENGAWNKPSMTADP
jgi:hypothetical protein